MNVIVRKPSKEEIEFMEKCDKWEHDIGSFDWQYKEKKEVCLIIEGDASIVDDKSKEEIFFTKGDLVIFPTFWDCKWNITKKIIKYFIFDSNIIE